MGKLYFKNKDYKLAESSFTEYLNSCPEDFQALKLLAQTYEFQRDFSKAFDAYERCYLAEPERKGVLLDICRLLLMNDSNLDHVDSRKWLKLAIQSFPSNPIVVNLKQSLPIVDQGPSKSSVENEILAKLTSIERRLEAIESNLASLSFPKITAAASDLPLTDGLKKLEIKSSTPAIVSSPSASISTQTAKVEQQDNHRSPDKNGHQNVNSNIEKPLEPPQSKSEIQLSSLQICKPSAHDSKPKETSTVSNPPLSFSFGGVSNANLFAESIKKFDIKSTMPSFGNLQSSSATKEEKPSASIFSSLSAVQDGEKSATTKTLFNSGTSFSNGKEFGTGLSLFGSSPSSQDKNDSTPGKSLFSGLSVLGQKEQKPPAPLFSGTTTSKDDKGDESDDDGPVRTEELPIENTCDMKPIEMKSGEEDEDVLFMERCKLFRFRDKEYKERGVGDIKFLKHRTTGKGRLIMRREQINLVCLNCWSLTKVERVRETQLRFAGIDASDGEPEMSVFIVKFKNAEIMDRFESHLRDLRDDQEDN